MREYPFQSVASGVAKVCGSYALYKVLSVWDAPGSIYLKCIEFQCLRLLSDSYDDLSDSYGFRAPDFL